VNKTGREGGGTVRAMVARGVRNESENDIALLMWRLSRGHARNDVIVYNIGLKYQA
jgi:hypothetical protein